MTTTLEKPGAPVHTINPQDETPLFRELAATWAAFGRMVPGSPDPEWDRLIAGQPGRRRRSRLVPRQGAA